MILPPSTYFSKEVCEKKKNRFFSLFSFLKIVFLKNYLLFIICSFLAVFNAIINFNIGVNLKDSFIVYNKNLLIAKNLKSEKIILFDEVKNEWFFSISGLIDYLNEKKKGEFNISEVERLVSIIEKKIDGLNFAEKEFSDDVINCRSVKFYLGSKSKLTKNVKNYMELINSSNEEEFNNLIKSSFSFEENAKRLFFLSAKKILENFLDDRDFIFNSEKGTIFNNCYSFFINFFGFKFFENDELNIYGFVSRTVVLIIFKSIFSLLHFYLMHYAYDLIEKEMKEDLFRHFIKSNYYRSFSVSKNLFTQFSSDLDLISYDIWFIPNRLIYALFSILYHVFFDFNFGVESPNLRFIFVMIFIFSVLISAQLILFGFSDKINTVAKTRISKDNSVIYSSISRLQNIKSVSGEEYEKKKISDRLNKSFGENKLSLLLNVVYKAVPNYLISPNVPVLFIFLVIVVSGGKNNGIEFLCSNFIRYYFTVQKLNSEINKIIDSLLGLNDLSGSLNIVSDSVWKLSHYNNNELNFPRKVPFSNGDIIFKNVSFSYPGRKRILNSFDFLFEKGKTYGIVGNNGAGKSTIIKLMLGLYNIENGYILIGENNINDLNIRSLHDNVCYQTNKPGDGFFEGTIIDNILYPKKWEDFEDKNDLMNKLNIASKEVEIHNFIETLPNKLESFLDGASELSEGQKQQIAAMKIFINDYNVYIFDEPLSNVSPELRKRILHRIFEKIKGKTVLVIDHRVNETFDREEFIGNIYRLSNNEGDISNLRKKDEFTD